MMATPAELQYVTLQALASVAVDDTVTVLLAADNDTDYLLLYNAGPETAWVAFGGDTPAVGAGIPIRGSAVGDSGGSYETPAGTSMGQRVRAICGAGLSTTIIAYRGV